MVRIYFLFFRIEVKWKGLRKFRKPFCRCSRLMTFGSTFLIWLFYLYFLIDDAPFSFRYAERIGYRSVSFYCFLLDNFFLQNFLCFHKRVLGESISPNEASGTLGKWLAITKTKYFASVFSADCFPILRRSDRLSIAHIFLHIWFIFIFTHAERVGKMP